MTQSESEDWMQCEATEEATDWFFGQFQSMVLSPLCCEPMEHHGADGKRGAYLIAAGKQKVRQEEAMGKTHVLRGCPKWYNFSPQDLSPNCPFSMQLSMDKPTDGTRALKIPSPLYDWSHQLGNKLLIHKSLRVFHIQT